MRPGPAGHPQAQGQAPDGSQLPPNRPAPSWEIPSASWILPGQSHQPLALPAHHVGEPMLASFQHNVAGMYLDPGPLYYGQYGQPHMAHMEDGGGHPAHEMGRQHGAPKEIYDEVDQFKSYLTSLVAENDGMHAEAPMEMAAAPSLHITEPCKHQIPATPAVRVAQSQPTAPSLPTAVRVAQSAPTAPSLQRPLSHHSVPKPSEFLVKGVATGVCMLLPQLESGCTIDIDIFVRNIPMPLDLQMNRGCQIVGVSGGTGLVERGQMSRTREKSKKGGSATGLSERIGNRMQHACSVNMTLPGSDQIVSVKMYANAKTQATGCKSIETLVAANLCLIEALGIVGDIEYPNHDTTPIITFDHDANANFSIGHLRGAGSNPSNIKILKAPVQGVFDLGAKEVGVKLHMKNLARYLESPDLSHTVALVKQTRQEGNSSRFNQLCLYIKREAIKSWKEEDGGQSTAYVALFDTGKCNINAAPSEAVGREVAALVTKLLLRAFEAEDMKVPIEDSAPQPSATKQLKRSATQLLSRSGSSPSAFKPPAKRKKVG